ncbi:MAG: hypothetical protein ACE5GE_15825, partial [Phycisphaerae bacterium]
MAFAQPCVPVPSGLVSWWPGEGNFIDIQGANDGADAGGTTFVAGMVGQAFNFDGTANSYISIANDPELIPATNELTICAWVNPDFSAGSVLNTILTTRSGCSGNVAYNLNFFTPTPFVNLGMSDSGGA